MSEYLAIKNWAKFQSLRGKGKYIFDYTQQDDEPELCKLSMFKRAVLQEMRRIRGRIGKNIPYDTVYILSAMSAPTVDRPRIPSAIRELIACGLLILTNQQDDILKPGEKEIEKEKDKKQDVPVPQESKFDEAWKLYPKPTKPYEAERQWCDAVNREAGKQVKSYSEIESMILGKTEIFGQIMRGKLARGEIEMHFIPKMSDWLYAGSFLEEPSIWEALNSGKRSANGNAPSKLQESLRVIDNIEFRDKADVQRNPTPLSAPTIRS